VRVLQQILLRQDLPAEDVGVRTATSLPLALLSIVVVARWASHLFVIFLSFKTVYTTIDDY
jgi:hypothetical protein